MGRQPATGKALSSLAGTDMPPIGLLHACTVVHAACNPRAGVAVRRMGDRTIRVQNVNARHQRVVSWLRGCRGVASRYLPNWQVGARRWVERGELRQNKCLGLPSESSTDKADCAPNHIEA